MSAPPPQDPPQKPDPAPVTATGSPGKRDELSFGDAAQFVGALLGVLLVGITPNPPITVLDWVQMLSGAALTAVVTTTAVRQRVLDLTRDRATSLAGRLRKNWLWVVATSLLAVGVALAVPLLWDVGRGLSYRVLGCPPAVQLRVVAEPETVATARELLGRYENWTAEGNHGCPTVQAYVFTAKPAEVLKRVGTTDGWSDADDSLRTVGPRPDVWLASTRREVDAVTITGSAVAEALPVAHSPLVLAIPAGATRPTGTWPEVFRQLEATGGAPTRPDPRTTQVGRLATVLLYGRSTGYPVRRGPSRSSGAWTRPAARCSPAAPPSCSVRGAPQGPALRPLSSRPNRTSRATTRALRSARDALDRVQPGGGAPLIRAVTDGVTALSADGETASGEPVGIRALLVLTDGRDNASGTTIDDALDRVTGRGVRIVVVALGGIRCAEAGLGALADATGGECVESDPADVPGRVQEFVTRLRGGQS
jgi:hypothetical protein